MSVAGTEWDARAEAYRTSVTHARGADLDRVIELCEPRTGLVAIDVATGGGHVARRLREAGCVVTTVDPTPGMHPDVIARAEYLPFADGCFEVAVNRYAAHHYDDVAEAMRELARVASARVVVEDLLYQDDACEEAELLRDPTHKRNYTEAEWRTLFTGAGLALDTVEIQTVDHPLEEWIARTGCTGPDAQRVRELLAPRVVAGVWTNEVIILRGKK